MDIFWGPLGAYITGILDAYVLNALGTLCAGLVTFSATLYALWLILTGYRITIGETQALPTFNRAAWIAVAITFATTTALINGQVREVFDGLRAGLATAFIPPTMDPCAPTTPWQALDCMLNAQTQQLKTISAATASLNFFTDFNMLAPLWLLRISVALAGVILQIAAAFVILLSQFLASFGISLAPLFILAVIFPITRSYFSSWLSFMLNTCVLSTVTMFALGLSLSLSQWFIDRTNAAGGMINNDVLDPFLVGVLFFAVHIFLAILVFQGPSLSAMLVSGSGFSQGGSMVQNMLLYSRLGSSNSSNSSNGGVGTVRPLSNLRKAATSLGTSAGHLARGTQSAGRQAFQQIAARWRRH